MDIANGLGHPGMGFKFWTDQIPNVSTIQSKFDSIRVCSIYHASKNEVFTIYLFEEHGTTKGSE